VEEGLSLEEEIVRNPSVSLSPTLSKNGKVEQHIRKKTHKPNALRFWVEGGVIPLCGSAQFSLFEISPIFSPLDFPNMNNAKFHKLVEELEEHLLDQRFS